MSAKAYCTLLIILLFITSLFTPSAVFGKKKAAAAAPAPDPLSLLGICKSPGMAGFLQLLPNGSFSQPWQRCYAALVFNMATNDPASALVYWKPSGTESNQAMVSLKSKTFTPFAYTTETVLVLVCNAKFGDGTTSTNTSITLTLGDENVQPAHLAATDFGTVDRLYLLPSVTDNTLTQVNLNLAVKDPTNAADAAPEAASANGKKKPPVKKPVPKNHDVPSGQDNPPAAKTDVIAWALIERHRISHFSVGGGLVAFRARSTTYSFLTTPTTVTTQTCIAKLTTVTIPAPGTSTGTPVAGILSTYDPCSTFPPPSYPSNATSFESNITTATTAGTANYALRSNGSNWGVDALAGLTVYPFGRDTFPINTGKGFAVPYGFMHPSWHSVGMYMGTSVNNFGNFTFGPAYEFYPGLQLLTGVTFRSKQTLQRGSLPA